MADKPMTYREAGVDINKGNEAVEKIKPLVQRTHRSEVMGGLGGFGGLFELAANKYRNPVLVSGTDGVGTKLRLAFLGNKHNTIGIDAVAMCVNDILVYGAEPLFFLDYLAVGSLEPEQVADVVEGISEGCLQSNCALIGGETAEMPGFYQKGEYDVAGFAVGVVERDEIIDGSAIEEGDVIIGLPSTGLHSNGYSLARQIIFERAQLTIADQIEPFEESIGELLLKPTKIYVKDILPLVNSNRQGIRAMVHITGGGLIENIPRVLPKGLSADIVKDSWPVLPLFTWLKEQGQVPEMEMYRTFNMGIGFVLIVNAAEVENIKTHFDENGVEYHEIGHIVAGKRMVNLR